MSSKWIEDGFVITETRDVGQIRRVLVVTMVLNFVATAIKLAAGIATGALSVVADGLDSLFDGLSNVVGLAGMYAAARPPDASHPYGHRKFETLAALSIAILLFITTWQLLLTAVQRLLGRALELDISLWVAGAMVASMAVQAITSYYELRAGRRLKSEILIADALHTRASILVSFSVLAGLGLVRLGFPAADPLLAIFVAGVIAKIGVDVLKESLPVLVDRAAVDPRQIAAVVETIPGVESFHRVRSRGAVGSAAVDLHVRVSPEKSVREANAIADEVRRLLLEVDGISDVTVHVEPQFEARADAADLFAVLRFAAGPLGLTVHEAWAYSVNRELHLEAHVGVAPEMSVLEAHRLVDRLEAEMMRRNPEIKGMHFHIEPASAHVTAGDVPAPEVVQQVQRTLERLIEEMAGVYQPHNLLVHLSGDGDKLLVALDIRVDPDIPTERAHQMASRLEEELARRVENIVDVSIHVEPLDGRA